MGGMIPTRQPFDALGVSAGSVELVKNGPLDMDCLNPMICRMSITPEQQSGYGLRSVLRIGRIDDDYGNTSGAWSPVLASDWMCLCTCMARCTHWSLLWYS